MMNNKNLYYTFHNGKNPKWRYYLSAYSWWAMPHCIHKMFFNNAMQALKHRDDLDYIKERVDYYNKLVGNDAFSAEAFREGSVMLRDQQITGQKVYFLDAIRYAKAFAQSLRWILLPGDITHIPSLPSITKSRPIAGDNAFSVIMKLDKVRHFIFTQDKLSFHDKKNMCIFRGGLNPRRLKFVEKYDNNPLFNVGATKGNSKWSVPKMTIPEHLQYKFIMSIEGNDVASNLKWIMSSNSIAVMPKPTYETWFMEGKLVANYHYIEVAPDFSDVEERIRYYMSHPDEAEKIIRHAHEYVSQFRDKERENIISYLVLEKYFKITNHVPVFI